MTKLMDETFDIEVDTYFDRYFFYEIAMLLIFPWPGNEYVISM
jgi:hypothetical protein